VEVGISRDPGDEVVVDGRRRGQFRFVEAAFGGDHAGDGAGDLVEDDAPGRGTGFAVAARGDVAEAGPRRP
jgi:hypothetical protein